VPVAELRGCLGFETIPFNRDTRIVLVSYREREMGMVVDGVTEVTTLPGSAFQSMGGTQGDSPFVSSVARFQGALVLEIDHARVLDAGLAAERRAASAPVALVRDEEVAPLREASDGGLDIDLLESSFKLLAPQADRLAERFYERLFEVAPGVRPMFPDDLAEQRKALIASLGAIVSSLRTPDKMAEYLNGLALRHVEYGALDAHYDAVGGVLLATMAEIAGDAWSEELARAWGAAYGAVKQIMLAQAAQATKDPVGVRDMEKAA
jgi:hemoglobin-like flavoprotein